MNPLSCFRFLPLRAAKTIPVIVALLWAQVPVAGSPRIPIEFDPETLVGPERTFFEVSQIYSEFAGYYFDADGNLVVQLVHFSNEHYLSDKLQPILENRIGWSINQRIAALESRPLPDPVILFEHAEYSFLELLDMRSQLVQVLPHERLSGFGIDYRRNRVLVSIFESGTDMIVQDAMRNMGVPVDAVIIEERPSFKPTTTLRSKIWPTPGGMQIRRNHWHSCTLGFTRNVGWTWSFLTNSHCTSEMFGYSGSNFYQPSAWSWNKIGREFWDPSGSPCKDFPGDICRYSDVAAIRYESGGGGTGTIARTGDWLGGNIDVVGEFEIIGHKLYPDIGDIVDKVGRTTGWTWGEVYIIGYTATIDGYPGLRLLGQAILENLSEASPFCSPGDSGAPVFIWGSGWTVYSAGILWGSLLDGEIAAFSPIENIQTDFGGQIIGWW